MSYARTNWTAGEIERALGNPVQLSGGAPGAHSSKHGVSGELANHPLFQRARVNAIVVQTGKKGKLQAKPEVGTHSTLSRTKMAEALARAFNNDRMQPHLGTLDAGNIMKVDVNFIRPVGQGTCLKTGQAPRGFAVRSMFVYCKPNPNNGDIPIFQTVVPKDTHARVGQGNTPVVIVS